MALYGEMKTKLKDKEDWVVNSEKRVITLAWVRVGSDGIEMKCMFKFTNQIKSN